MRQLLIALALVACGDNSDLGSTDGDPRFASGDRLIAPEAGATDWFDRELGVECRFEPVGGEVHRCLPIAPPVSGFADAGCTRPAALAAVRPRFIRVGQIVYETGTRVSDQYRLDDSGDCERLDVELAVYSIGPLAPEAGFARAVEVVR